MGGWITVRMLGTGQVQEMMPSAARSYIEQGVAVDVNAKKPQKEIPVVEVAAVQPVVETAVMAPGRRFKRGPRTRP